MYTLILISATCNAGTKYHKSKLKEGDIIFQETVSPQARAIKLATSSRYTHVGVIFKYHNILHVFEAVQPVRITKLRTFINRGLNGHFVIKRLIRDKQYLTKNNLKKMKSYGRYFLGKNYDIYFEWSNRDIYCTELIWKIFYKVLKIRLGKLQKLKEFNLKHPYVQKIMKRRYGNNIPYNEPVISPDAMFRSKHLKTVFNVD